jgi:hypothetical protein
MAVSTPTVAKTVRTTEVGVSNGNGAAHAPAAGEAVTVFESPEAAMLAVAAAAEAGDHDRMTKVFGHDCHDVVESDDRTADGDDCARVARMIRERLAFEDAAEGRKIAVIGLAEWRFPVPIAKTGRGYEFDLDRGRDELGTREIGRNELLTIAALEELAEAQHEYAAESREGKRRGFADRFVSQNGSARDGLYWTPAEGEKASPIGPLLAAAAAESGPSAREPKPFNGYVYKMVKPAPLPADGKETRPVPDARPTHGCGAVAWPAEYGVTGVMTFIVSHAGIVFEKDLGPDTAAQAQAMTTFDPGPGWRPTRR